jgi:hypothetical protein
MAHKMEYNIGLVEISGEHHGVNQDILKLKWDHKILEFKLNAIGQALSFD